MLTERGVRVWFEIDLVAAWLAGQDAFDTAIDRMATLGRVPGVAGFKIADELGYNDGITSQAQADEFLRTVDKAVAGAAPDAKLLVDLIVPQLGCLQWRDSAASQSCANAVAEKHPATTTAAVRDYLRSGTIDVVDVSTGLLAPATYEAWGLDRDLAQEEAWSYIEDTDLAGAATLQARKAMAQPGGYAGSAHQASADVRTYVSIPVSHQAVAVDIWTWRQPYQGSTVSLLENDNATNPLWEALRAERDGGTSLFTHMTPSTLDGRWSVACDRVAQVFDNVFVAAGSG